MATTPQDELLRSASFVFVGTLRQLGASAMPEISAAANTAVVEIEQVLVAPPAFKERRGNVTLALPAGDALAAGATRAFYCTAWKLGSGLALRCLAHRAAPATRKAVGARMAAASVNVQGADLRTRLFDADLVATAVVRSVRPLPAPPGPVSEHDPHWHVALLQIESVIRGEAPGAELSLYFPASDDVAWAHAPKPQAGQRGVWALRSAASTPAAAKTQRGLQALPPSGYTALHPLDFQPLSALPSIRVLTRPKAARAPRRIPLGSGS